MKKAKQKIKRLLSPSPTAGPSTGSTASPIPSSGSTTPSPSTSTKLPTAFNSPVNVQPLHFPPNADQNKQKRALELTSSFQTLLGIVEKTLDGVPVWGPKAIIEVAQEVVRITQLKKDNDDTIKKIQRDAENIISITAPSSGLQGAIPQPTKTELEMRVDKLRDEVTLHLHDLDQYQAAQPIARSADLKEKIKKWLVTGGETLAAEAISNALPEVNGKIATSIQNFMLVSQIKSEELLLSIDQNVKILCDKNASTLVTNEERGLLTQLNPVKTALHSSKGAPRSCHEGTRVAILEHVKTWFRDPQSPSLLWLSGMAGTGKTAISQSICEILAPELGASFLFSRDFAERQDPSNVLPTIAHQLAHSRPILRPAICEMVSRFPHFASMSVRVQAQELMSRVLGSDLTFDFPVTLLLFDALDECSKEEEQEGGDLIPLLLSFLRRYPSRFKVVITSRPEPSIRGMLEGKHGQADMFVLHEVDKNMIQSDIESYLCYELEQIAKRKCLEADWPANLREDQVKQLVRLADRLFIYAATVVKTLLKSPFPGEKISSFLNNTTDSTQTKLSTLDSMYLQIVRTVFPDDMDALDIELLVETFQRVVGAIITLQTPLPFFSLKALVNVKENQLRAIIGPLYSVLDIDDSLKRPIQAFHLSFPDFIQNDQRCIDKRFCILPKKAHSMLSHRCLMIMNENLEPDICKIGDPSLLNVEIEDLPERLEHFTSAELRYACSYWWTHLAHVESPTKELMLELKKFTSRQLLRWLELLSLMGKLQSALTGLPKVTKWYKELILSSKLKRDKQDYTEEVSHFGSVNHLQAVDLDKRPQINSNLVQDLTNVMTVLYDINRTVQAFFQPISKSALHVYESASTFLPRCSLLFQLEQLHSNKVEMVSERCAQWSQDVRVMEGHKKTVHQVDVSPNGSLVASREQEGPIKLWDFDSGTEIMHIETKSFYLTFSPDSLHVLSLTGKKDILETWEVISGDKINTFHLNLKDPLYHIRTFSECSAISSTGQHTVVGHENGSLHLFGIDGTITQLYEYDMKMRVVAFSQDGLLVASGSHHHFVCVWNIATISCIAKTWVPAQYAIFQVCISPDSLRVVAATRGSGGRLGKVWVWEISTQQVVSAFEIPYYAYSLAVSVNNTTLTCLLNKNGTLCTYDITLGRCLSVLKGHTLIVAAAMFVPGGSYIVSGSEDQTIRIWDTQSDVVPDSSESSGMYGKAILDLALSVDGTKLASTFDDKTICWYEIRSGRMISKIEREARILGLLPGGTTVGLNWEGYDRPAIDVWNAETGETITTLEGHTSGMWEVAFSPDFTRVVSGSKDDTVRIWSTATWECTAVLKGHRDIVASVRFSPDGSRVASGSLDETVRVWDATTGDVLAVLRGHPRWVISVRFSSDGLTLVSKDKGGNHREWKAGVDFPLLTSPSPLPPVELDDAGWLFVAVPPSHRRRRICWVPVERRGVIRSSGPIVALGSATGLVTILKVSNSLS